MGRDISGFVDGTRNPDHLLRAIVDQVVIFPRDDSGRHVGGTYMYAGIFEHDLAKFRMMNKKEKNEIIGRDYDVVKKHVGYDFRPENPRLDEEEHYSSGSRNSGPSPNAYHVNRGHAAIYRQAMPYIEGSKEGLYFIAFSRTISEFDSSLRRMAGHFQPDGSLDNLFLITKAVTSSYYYVPSLVELFLLPKADYLTNVPIIQITAAASLPKRIRIIAEYCTNCGYKTIFLEKRKFLESLSPEIEIIENPQSPRLAAFEFYTEDGKILFSKLALRDGMNNFPHCFPTNKQLAESAKNLLKIDGIPSEKFTNEKVEWGMTSWN